MKILDKFKRQLKAPSTNEIHLLQLVMHVLSLLCLIFFPKTFFIGVIWGWFIANLGGGLIGHRYVSHRQFEISSPYIKAILYIFYNLNLIGSAVNYANIHILHHNFSDDIEKDPTTWKRPGLLKCHFSFYEFDFKGKIKLRYFKKLMSDKYNRFFHEYYYLPVLLLTFITLLIKFEYFLGFVAVPAVVAFHIAQLQVSILHYPIRGSFRPDKTTEAYNIPWMKFLLLGEELHNNHHADPNNPNRNLNNKWRELDPLFAFIIKPFFKIN
jgi:fatty-acid desaturase